MSKTLLFAAIAVAAVFTGLPTMPVRATASDYRFEMDGQPVKSGKAMVVKIRLVHIPDGKPVAGAIIIQTRLDMGPDGMAEMTAPAKAVPGADPGIYQIEVEPSMMGRWGLTLAAKVQGEPATVRGTITLTVPK
jgi:hypothetical protein